MDKKRAKKKCTARTFGKVSRMELMRLAGFTGLQAYEALVMGGFSLDWYWRIAILGRAPGKKERREA